MGKTIVGIGFLLVFIASEAFAQKTKSYEYIGLYNFPLHTETGMVTYEGVIETKEKSAENLYNTALFWLTQNNKGRIWEQQPGKFISGRNEVKTISTTIIKYDFLMEFKDGRYRYMLNNFVVSWSSGSSPLESFFPAKIKNGKTAKIHDKNMQEMNIILKAEANKLAGIGAQDADW
ncbi:hypothetical protein [Pontibacter sp. SGAir0037]|uniref:hypothetical protein n=1 Tax=Pontibacter sp. SGAir0037 TaxID=2571030 RepID=UPI0010F9D093|nr:hypothetical protein [Pontibacter sp. SGAir0037]